MSIVLKELLTVCLYYIIVMCLKVLVIYKVLPLLLNIQVFWSVTLPLGMQLPTFHRHYTPSTYLKVHTQRPRITSQKTSSQYFWHLGCDATQFVRQTEVYYCNLMVEVVGSCKMLVPICKTTWCHIAGDNSLWKTTGYPSTEYHITVMIALSNSNLHELFCEIKRNKYISHFKTLCFYSTV